jgi:hypothetical protein
MKQVIRLTPLLLISITFQNIIYAQTSAVGKKADEYTIENCVNELDLSKATKTKSGHQYWFASRGGVFLHSGR